MSAFTRMIAWDDLKLEQTIAEVMNFRRSIMDKQKFTKTTDVVPLIFWNHAAPSLVGAETVTKQAGLLSWALNENMAGAGIVVRPAYCYQRGHLVLEIQKLQKLLMDGNHNIDHGFSVLFTEQDSRDKRPLTYGGHIVFASPIGDINNSAFGGSELVRRGRTDEVPQLHGTEMREPEDLDPFALPSTTDSRDGVKGAKKYSQLGVRAVEAMLSGMLNGMASDKVPGLLVIDPFPRVGETMEAFFKVRQTVKTPLYYIGLSQDAIEREWIIETQKNILSEKYETDLRLPGGEKVQEKINEDLLEPFPPAPKMNMLTIIGTDSDVKKTLGIDAKIVQEWGNKSNFTKQFTEWLDEFTQEGNSIVEGKLTPETGKRKNNGEPDGATPMKKPHVDLDVEIVALADITSTLICEVKATGVPKDAGWLQIRSGHSIYLVNKSGQATTFPVGFFLCSFGKGSFKVVKENMPTAIPFQLENSDSLVVVDGAMTTLEDEINKKRKDKPDAKICYYELIPSEDLMGYWQNLMATVWGGMVWDWRWGNGGLGTVAARNHHGGTERNHQ